MAYSNKEKIPQSEAAVKQFTEMMISRMKEMKASDWKQGWMGGTKPMSALPQNLNGRNYSGLNSLFLQWKTIQNNYNMPVFLTFHQAQEEELRIKAGSKSFPVLYWGSFIKDKDGNKLSEADYRNMSREEREECKVKWYLRAFNVFNVDQTNMQEVKPEKYKALQERFQPQMSMDVSGMYENRAMDRMIDTQGWVCPIRPSDTANSPYYSLTSDTIVVPHKYRFRISDTPQDIYKDGMEYYSSTLHEMAHSTGSPERLSRFEPKEHDRAKYAREELVAELTAAMVGNTMGFDKRILDNNAAYLDSWIKALREDSKFLVSVMSDVNKASQMIYESIDKQKLALGERPLLYTNLQKESSQKESLSEDKSNKDSLEASGQEVSAAIFKKTNGEYAVQATVNGNALDPLEIDRKTGAQYMALPSGESKSAALHQIVNATYGENLRMYREKNAENTHSLKI